MFLYFSPQSIGIQPLRGEWLNSIFHSFEAGISNVFPSLIMIIWQNILQSMKIAQIYYWINPFKSEFTIVIFIHYKPRIAAAILDF